MSDEIESAMSDAKQKKAAWDEAVTELIEEYSQKLQDIYEKRTAGDFTFLGVLGEYTMKLDQLRSMRPTNVTNVFQSVGAVSRPPNNRPGLSPAMQAKIVGNQRARNRY